MDNRKGYKAFKKGLICAPDENHVKQYEENTTYEEEGGKICGAGMMHYCVNPLDCLSYYPLIDDNGELTEFAEVEALDEPVTDDSKKFATKKLHIGAKLKFKDYVDAAVGFLYEKTIKEMPDAKIGSSGYGARICSSGYAAKIGSSGDAAKICSSGYAAKICSSGYAAKIGSSGNAAQIGSSGDATQIGSLGDAAKICSSGYAAKIGSSGNGAQIGSSGDAAQIGSSGDAAQIGSSGDAAKIGSSGYAAKIGSSGYGAKINCTGNNSVICCAGNGSVVKAKKGCWITLSEWSCDSNKYIPICVKTEFVDGERIKADTWYKLENGEFVEVEK